MGEEIVVMVNAEEGSGDIHFSVWNSALYPIILDTNEQVLRQWTHRNWRWPESKREVQELIAMLQKIESEMRDDEQI